MADAMGQEEYYAYDAMGRLKEKTDRDGYVTAYRHAPDGKTESILYGDGTSVEMEYDVLRKLVKVKDWLGTAAIERDRQGRPLAITDHKGRLSEKQFPKGLRTRWLYGGKGQLKELIHEDKEGVLDRYSYEYDGMGNKTAITRERRGLTEESGRYEYGAMDRMTRAWNSKGQESDYFYNGLGQRTGRTINGEEEDYLLDLSKPYHNLLGISKGDSRQNFYFDNNVSVMEEEGNLHYYLQDELGSQLRVSGYGVGKETADIRNKYLTYGYDEFGNDLYKELEEAGIPCPYDRQGEEQPFGYTGYRYDNISGTYFAQAREYQPENGRFMAEDIIKGNGVVPNTLNRYGYCWGNPVGLVDLNGLTPEEGDGEFYSFMGTSSQGEALKGKTSLGYMGHESLTKEGVDEFLSSGDIDVTMADGSKNLDNYDRALKRDISYDE